MVEVKYTGRLGNNLFQYCFGRILALRLGYKLKADPIQGFSNTKKEVGGFDYSPYPEQVLLSSQPKIKRNRIDIDAICKDRSNRKIVVDGYFQRYEHYKPYKDLIRNDWLWIKVQSSENINKDDIVVHIRRGDYILRKQALPFSYYEQALQAAKFDRLFICADFPDDPFLKLFNKYKPIIHHTPDQPLKDFKFMTSFNKIVLSTSTFSWWASFLSNAAEVYTPQPSFGYWNENLLGINLRVDDESRYMYIKCGEMYKGSFSDILRSAAIMLKQKLEYYLSKVKLLKVTALVMLFMAFAAPSFAINIFEKIAYKRDVIKLCNAKVLVNPLNNEVRYIWYETVISGKSGHWEPVSGTSKMQFQAMYDQQKSSK